MSPTDQRSDAIAMLERVDLKALSPTELDAFKTEFVEQLTRAPVEEAGRAMSPTERLAAALDEIHEVEFDSLTDAELEEHTLGLDRQFSRHQAERLAAVAKRLMDGRRLEVARRVARTQDQRVPVDGRRSVAARRGTRADAARRRGAARR
jgi:hypothetical protein